MKECPWSQDPRHHLSKKFRRRFRLPHPVFLKLMEMHRTAGDFEEAKPDATGRLGIPLELKILGVLRYLGRNETFDSIAEAANTSEEVHRTFLQEFAKVYATKYAPLHIRMPDPSNLAEVASTMKEYSEAGFPGCIGNYFAVCGLTNV